MNTPAPQASPRTTASCRSEDKPFPARSLSPSAAPRRGIRPASPRGRLLAAFLALTSLLPLALAVWITPDPAGLGSHVQLHLPACGFYERTGYPCPTCGMTTAFALTVRGRLLRAFATQPAGTLAALACAFIAGAAGFVALVGRRLDQLTDLLYWHWTRLIAAGVVVVLLSWLYCCLLTYVRTH